MKAGAYQIQLPQSLGSIRQVHNSVVRQIRTIRQNQPLQLRELVDTPVLETAVCDCSTTRKIDRL